jgi:hypothetical protein
MEENVGVEDEEFAHLINNQTSVLGLLATLNRQPLRAPGVSPKGKALV